MCLPLYYNLSYKDLDIITKQFKKLMNSMVIIGAGGLAMEILEILKQNSYHSKIYFLDNINSLEKNYCSMNIEF